MPDRIYDKLFIAQLQRGTLLVDFRAEKFAFQPQFLTGSPEIIQQPDTPAYAGEQYIKTLAIAVFMLYHNFPYGINLRNFILL
jgi:hypothetical protein